MHRVEKSGHHRHELRFGIFRDLFTLRETYWVFHRRIFCQAESTISGLPSGDSSPSASSLMDFATCSHKNHIVIPIVCQDRLCGNHRRLSHCFKDRNCLSLSFHLCALCFFLYSFPRSIWLSIERRPFQKLRRLNSNWQLTISKDLKRLEAIGATQRIEHPQHTGYHVQKQSESQSNNLVHKPRQATNFELGRFEKFERFKTSTYVCSS